MNTVNAMSDTSVRYTSPYQEEERAWREVWWPEGLWKPFTIAVQVSIFKTKGFGQFSSDGTYEFAELIASLRLPAGADGLVVIPRPSKIASNYHDALSIVLRMLRDDREDWQDDRECILAAHNTSLCQGTQEAWAYLEARTPGDFLVIPVQTGGAHFHQSPRRSEVCMSQSRHNEFPLGPLEGALILLCHPNRLRETKNLVMEFPGMRCFDQQEEGMTRCPMFDHSGGELRLGTIGVSDPPLLTSGAASGWVVV